MACEHPSPAAYQAQPLLRHLAEDVEPGADVGAPLRVMCRRAQQGPWPLSPTLLVPLMQVANCAPEILARVTAHLVQRCERHIAIERRILDPFGCGGSAGLLESLDEACRGLFGG